MLRRISFWEFIKKYRPDSEYHVYEGGSVCVPYGLIKTTGLGGCTACVIFLERSSGNLGAMTHFRPRFVDEHLREIKSLVDTYPELRNAQYVNLFWDGESRESRYRASGNIYKLVNGINAIFPNSRVKDEPYPGSLDWLGLYVEKGLLVTP